MADVDTRAFPEGVLERGDDAGVDRPDRAGRRAGGALVAQAMATRVVAPTSKPILNAVMAASDYVYDGRRC
jgi:hypothetical protein